MTATPEPGAQPSGSAPPPPPSAKPNRLYQVAAWVVIVAGTIFVASAIFLAGAYVAGDGWGGYHHHHGTCPMQHGPPPMGPDFGPGPAGPGNRPAHP